MIYFVQAIDGGPIKVGQSGNVEARIKQLEAIYGRELAVLGTMPGGRDEERRIHEKFAHLRFGRTEQFRPEADLLAFIGRPLFVSAVPVVEAMACEETVIAMKCRPAYKEWVETWARERRTNPSQLIDIALYKFARLNGIELPPSRR